VARGVTVREVLDLPALHGARVVGGASGLDHGVRQVNVMEVPDILSWVKPDELLLTTAYPLRDDRAALADLIPNLAARGLAGVAIKPARYIESIPQAMTEAADRLSFPLIELPPEAVLGEIINSVLSAVLNDQAMRLQRAAILHDRFTGIVLSGGGLREIAEALGQSIGRQVLIVDTRGVLQASVPTLPAGGLERIVAAHSDLPAASGPSPLVVDGRQATAQPIQVGPERFGAIVAMGEIAGLGEDDLDALENAATVAALRQVQARAVAEADRRFQTVCLEELVTGHVTDRAVLMERAVSFAWDLAVPRAVVIVQLDEVGGQPFASLIGTAQEALLRHRLADAARLALGRSAIVWERSLQVAALLDPGPRGLEGLNRAAARLAAEARRAVPDGVASVGAGRVKSDALRLQDSYMEARRALAIGRWAKGPGQVSVFEGLGVDRLLVELGKAELSDFASTQLDPLVAYDGRHHADLMVSLEAYLDSRNAAQAARRLFVHYNTMKNRLRTIEDLIGPFRDDPDRCLGLAIALRVRRLPPE
jgi:purine catabolism regulator